MRAAVFGVAARISDYVLGHHRRGGRVVGGQTEPFRNYYFVMMQESRIPDGSLLRVVRMRVLFINIADTRSSAQFLHALFCAAASTYLRSSRQTPQAASSSPPRPRPGSLHQDCAA